MRSVVFAIPYTLETTMRFARAVASLPGVRLGVLTQEPPERFPQDVARRAEAVVKVEDLHDADQLEAGVRELAAGAGGRVDRLVGILETLQEPLAEVRERLRIPGMDRATAENFRDKARMKEVLRAHDLPCAGHRLARSPEEALEFAEAGGLPLVVKPPAGAGARNTFRVDELDQLRSYLRTQPPTADAPVLLEEFVLGREHSFDAVTLGGRHVFHSISHYRSTPLEVMERPWLQWCVQLPRDIGGPRYADITSAAPRALAALGMVTGLSHMEWFRRPDGTIAISEVGARPPGAQFTTLLSYAHDLDFYRAWAELVVLDHFRPPERRYSAGAVYLRGQGSGKVVRIEGLRQVLGELGDLVVEARIPREGQPRADSYEGEGHVILRHPETEEVSRGLERIVKSVRVHLG